MLLIVFNFEFPIKPNCEGLFFAIPMGAHVSLQVVPIVPAATCQTDLNHLLSSSPRFRPVRCLAAVSVGKYIPLSVLTVHFSFTPETSSTESSTTSGDAVREHPPRQSRGGIHNPSFQVSPKT